MRRLLPLLLLATATSALELGGPVVLRPGEPIRLAWAEASAASSLRVELTPSGGRTSLCAPLPARGGAAELPNPGPGWYRLRAALVQADGRPLQSLDATVAVVDAPTIDSDVLGNALPHLAEALRARGTARLAVVASPGFVAVRPGLPQMLVTLLAGFRAFTIIEPPPSAPGQPMAIERLARWLDALSVDAVLVDADALCPGWPPAVAAARLAAMAVLADDHGADAIVLSPLPRPADPWSAVVAAELTRQAVGGRGRVIDAATTLWPTSAADPAGLMAALAQLGELGSPTPAAHVALAGRLLTDLAGGEPPAPTVAVVPTLDQRVQPPRLRLSVANRTPAEQHVRVELAWPAGLPPGREEVLAPGGSTAIDASPETAPTWLLGALFCRPAAAGRPLLARPRPEGLGLSLVPGRQVFVSDPALPVRLTEGRDRVRDGVLSGDPGLPVTPWRIGARGTAFSAAAIALSGDSVVRRVVTVTAEAQGDRVSASARVTIVPAAVARAATAEVDGRLGDWRDDAWHTVALPAQVVAGRAAWAGPAEASLRWAVRSGAAGLQLAVVVTAPRLGDDDRLDLLLDARAGNRLGAPGMVARWSLAPRSLSLSGPGAERARVAGAWDGAQRLIELELPWPVVGRRPATGELLGFDLQLSTQGGRVVLSHAAQAWSWVDPARLGLLHIGELTGPLPARAWVDDPLAERGSDQ